MYGSHLGSKLNKKIKTQPCIPCNNGGARPFIYNPPLFIIDREFMTLSVNIFWTRRFTVSLSFLPNRKPP